MLKEEKEDSVAPELPELNTEAEADVDGEELDSSDMSAIIYEIPKEPEKWVLGWMGGTKGKEQLQAYSPLGTDPDATGSFLSRRRRSKRSRVMDADGLLEMFHCPYEGCSQVYVALSSFQVRPPPGRPVAKSSWPGSCGCMWLYWVSVAQGLRPGTHFVPTGLAGHLAFSALSLCRHQTQLPGLTSSPDHSLSLPQEDHRSPRGQPYMGAPDPYTTRTLFL